MTVFKHQLPVKDLIQYLSTLNPEATIALLNVPNGTIEEVAIKAKTELSDAESEAIEGRNSNQARQTDYYLV